GYIALQALAIGTFFFAPLDSWTHVLWQVFVGWISAAFVFFAVRARRSRGGAAWYCFGLGVFLNAAGILVAELIKPPDGRPLPIPSLADPFWLAIFPALAIGMALLIRRTFEKDPAALIDAAII